MLCGVSSSHLHFVHFCLGRPGRWLCLPVSPPHPSRSGRPAGSGAGGSRCLGYLLGQEGGEGQYLHAQLIHLPPELGRALGDHDGSRRGVNVKGIVTPCRRRHPCSAGRLWGREPRQVGPTCSSGQSQSPPQGGAVSGAAGPSRPHINATQGLELTSIGRPGPCPLPGTVCVCEIKRQVQRAIKRRGERRGGEKKRRE